MHDALSMEGVGHMDAERGLAQVVTLATAHRHPIADVPCLGAATARRAQAVLARLPRAVRERAARACLAAAERPDGLRRVAVLARQLACTSLHASCDSDAVLDCLIDLMTLSEELELAGVAMYEPPSMGVGPCGDPRGEVVRLPSVHEQACVPACLNFVAAESRPRVAAALASGDARALARMAAFERALLGLAGAPAIAKRERGRVSAAIEQLARALAEPDLCLGPDRRASDRLPSLCDALARARVRGLDAALLDASEQAIETLARASEVRGIARDLAHELARARMSRITGREHAVRRVAEAPLLACVRGGELALLELAERGPEARARESHLVVIARADADTAVVFDPRDGVVARRSLESLLSRDALAPEFMVLPDSEVQHA